jgi:hypothetical protein
VGTGRKFFGVWGGISHSQARANPCHEQVRSKLSDRRVSDNCVSDSTQYVHFLEPVFRTGLPSGLHGQADRLHRPFPPSQQRGGRERTMRRGQPKHAASVSAFDAGASPRMGAPLPRDRRACGGNYPFPFKRVGIHTSRSARPTAKSGDRLVWPTLGGTSRPPIPSTPSVRAHPFPL